MTKRPSLNASVTTGAIALRQRPRIVQRVTAQARSTRTAGDAPWIASTKSSSTNGRKNTAATTAAPDRMRTPRPSRARRSTGRHCSSARADVAEPLAAARDARDEDDACPRVGLRLDANAAERRRRSRRCARRASAATVSMSLDVAVAMPVVVERHFERRQPPPRRRELRRGAHDDERADRRGDDPEDPVRRPPEARQELEAEHDGRDRRHRAHDRRGHGPPLRRRSPEAVANHASRFPAHVVPHPLDDRLERRPRREDAGDARRSGAARNPRPG